MLKLTNFKINIQGMTIPVSAFVGFASIAAAIFCADFTSERLQGDQLEATSIIRDVTSIQNGFLQLRRNDKVFFSLERQVLQPAPSQGK